MDKFKIICSNCNSKKVVKRGYITTKQGKKQRYYCKECKKKFIYSQKKTN